MIDFGETYLAIKPGLNESIKSPLWAWMDLAAATMDSSKYPESRQIRGEVNFRGRELDAQDRFLVAYSFKKDIV